MKKRMIFGFIFIVLLSFGVLLYYRTRFSNYKAVTNKSSFTIKVEKLFNYRGFCYINDSLQVEPMFLKDGITNKWFSELVVVGDSIVKKENSYHIVLIKNNNSFIFYLSNE